MLRIQTAGNSLNSYSVVSRNLHHVICTPTDSDGYLGTGQEVDFSSSWSVQQRQLGQQNLSKWHMYSPRYEHIAR